MRGCASPGVVRPCAEEHRRPFRPSGRLVAGGRWNCFDYSKCGLDTVPQLRIASSRYGWLRNNRSLRRSVDGHAITDRSSQGLCLPQAGSRGFQECGRSNRIPRACGSARTLFHVEVDVILRPPAAPSASWSPEDDEHGVLVALPERCRSLRPSSPCFSSRTSKPTNSSGFPALVAAVDEMPGRCIDVTAHEHARALRIVEVVELDERVAALLVQLAEEERHALAVDVHEERTGVRRSRRGPLPPDAR